MRICIIGLVPTSRITDGIREFNLFLAKTLIDMGHRVDIGIPDMFSFSFQNKELFDSLAEVGIRGRIFQGLLSDVSDYTSNVSEATLREYDHIIVSGGRGLNFTTIMRAAIGIPVTVWSHGVQNSPLTEWDGQELTRTGNNYVVINESLDHQYKYNMHGEKRPIRIDLPVSFERRKVQTPNGNSVAVGNLEVRKNYADVDFIAAALNTSVDVYGSVFDDEQNEIVKRSSYLQHHGRLLHDDLMDAISYSSFIIHASKNEGFPMAIREANGQGIPAITWDMPLYRDGLDPEKNILLDPTLPIDEQLADVNLDRYLSMENREALAAETFDKYGPEVFKKQLEELLT